MKYPRSNYFRLLTKSAVYHQSSERYLASEINKKEAQIQFKNYSYIMDKATIVAQTTPLIISIPMLDLYKKKTRKEYKKLIEKIYLNIDLAAKKGKDEVYLAHENDFWMSKDIRCFFIMQGFDVNENMKSVSWPSDVSTMNQLR